MSKIEKLIQKHCPDGVEYKHLWEVTTWDKRFNAVDNYKQPQVIKYKYFLASELKPLIVEGGTIKILTTNISNLYTTEDLAEENYSEGEIIAIPWGGNPIVQYFNGKFLTSDNRIAISNDLSYLNTKYLYYCLLDSIDIISTFYRGSGIKHPNMAKVLDFQIPIPPLPIQQEIVAILDKFTQLEAELEAELEARLQQYEYYRNQLLSFEDKEVEWKAIKSLVELKRGTRVVKSQLSEVGQIPVYQNSLKPLGYFDKSNVFGNTTYIICAGAAGDIGFSKIPFWAADDCFVFLNSNTLNSKYLYYFLKTKQDFLYSRVRRASIPRLSRENIENIKIPIPSLEEQARIVNILDQFDALVNDIKTGLPAEIKARKEQYEYYRSKLLTFKRVS